MNKLIALLFLCVLVVSGCSKDKDEDPNLSIAFLKQTGWKGTVSYYVSGRQVEDEISFLFTTENSGDVQVLPDGPLPFGYSVDGKRLIIRFQSLPMYIDGDWMVIEKSKSKLVLGKYIGSQQNSYTLRLRKFY